MPTRPTLFRAAALLLGLGVLPRMSRAQGLQVPVPTAEQRRQMTARRATGPILLDGRLDRLFLSARWSPSPYVSARANFEVNRIESLGTADSSFVTHLAGPELRVFLNPRVQWSAFYQYNTAIEQGSLNARFSWEYAPLSYLYVVWNDRQPVLDGASARVRSLIVKLSWLRQL